MITYPLTLPTVGGPRALTVRPTPTGGSSESPFSGDQQFFIHPREFWVLDFELAPMRADDAEEWIGFLLGLNGREGTFYSGIPLKTAPRGAATGTPLVMGASQTGKTLVTDGWTPGVTNILKVGDCLQLGSGSNARLHRLAQSANSNGSGQATLELWPRIQIAPADNAPVITSNPVGVFRLMESAQEWNVELAKIHTMRFSARSEA